MHQVTLASLVLSAPSSPECHTSSHTLLQFVYPAKQPHDACLGLHRCGHPSQLMSDTTFALTDSKYSCQTCRCQLQACLQNTRQWVCAGLLLLLSLLGRLMRAAAIFCRPEMFADDALLLGRLRAVLTLCITALGAVSIDLKIRCLP